MRLTVRFAGRGIDWNANSFAWIRCLLAINVLPRVSDPGIDCTINSFLSMNSSLLFFLVFSVDLRFDSTAGFAIDLIVATFPIGVCRLEIHLAVKRFLGSLFYFTHLSLLRPAVRSFYYFKSPKFV